MKLLNPLHCTPKQWIAFCNTFFLFLLTFMCALVLYEISILDRRFISVIDSSTVAIDLLNLANSQKTPSWKKVTDGISVYSAFYDFKKAGDNHILIIGSRFKEEIRTGDLRCLIDYGNDGDLVIENVDYKVDPNGSAIFLYCPTKKEKIPERVALLSYSNTIPKQWMHVFLIYSRMEMDLKVSACVQPITRKVQVKQIAEFIAFYEYIGINHFNFYDCDASDDSVNFLRYLKDSGHSIKVLPWDKEIIDRESNGPLSEHVQDCLHRAMYEYSDVITVDVSDFFFLAETDRFVEILDNYRRLNGRPRILRLKSADFCNAPEDKDSSTLIGNMAFRGESRLSNTNYILAPDSVAAINFEDSFTANFENRSTENLPENYGIVHHFRSTCDSNVTLDKNRSSLKYDKVFKSSLMLEKYWRTSLGYVAV